MPTRKLTVHYQAGSARNLDFDISNSCPICLETMFPKYISMVPPYSETTTTVIPVTLQCTSCDKFFVTHFQFNRYKSSGYGIPSRPAYVSQLPIQIARKMSNPDIPKNVQQLSPEFVEIYKQALQAEIDGLDHLVGMGIRKALDYLVTDFCLHTHPDKSDKIQQQQLGKMLNTYFSDMPRVQKILEAAVWIGNDQTHYFTRHPDVGVSELKKFTDLLVRELSSELAFEEVEEFHELAN